MAPSKILFCSLLITLAGLITSYAKKPNVLFIVSDDLASSAMNSAITPHLDALAKEGITFIRNYSQYPACGPSRNSFLTGLRPDKVGGGSWTPFRDHAPDAVTLPQLFRQNGYFTASIGKIFHVSYWDDQLPTKGWRLCDDKSWDYRINCLHASAGATGNPPFARIGKKYELPGLSGLIDFAMMAFESDLEQEDGQATQEAIRQMELNQNQPFFIGVGYRRPHAPFVAPEKYFWPYPEEQITLPPTGDRSDVPEFAFNAKTPHYGDPEAMKQLKRAYLASVSFLDAQVGQLIQALKDNDLYENTVIVFLSDHGFQLGERGDWHKNTAFEESLRCPLIIKLPSQNTINGPNEELVQLVDLYPTLIEYCGLPSPSQALDGQSLLPLLQGNPQAWKSRPAFSQVERNIDDETRGVAYSVTDGRYRYSEYWTMQAPYEILAKELYDLEKDPVSEVNLATLGKHTEVIQTLSQLIAEYKQN